MRRSEVPSVFSSMHPVVPLAYLVGTIGISLCAVQPAYLAISLVGSLACSISLRGLGPSLRGLRWQLPMIALICLANPLFSASGSTILLRMGPVSVYAESLAYGACMGMMLVSMVLWFECASHMLGEGGVVYLGGRRLPTTALMLSMVMQLVPQLLRRSAGINATLDACTAAKGRRALPVRRSVRLTSVLMSWAMEDSLERADAMRARGWGAPGRRTNYQVHPFTSTDASSLVLVIALGLMNVPLAWVACRQWSFYPTMPTLVVWWGYLPFVLQVLLPSMIALLDRLRWRCLS